MIELPEAINLAKQMRETVRGKTVSAVYPPSSPHKFCWFNHEPEEYQALLAGHTVTGAAGFGIFSELEFDGGVRLCFNDGVNPRFIRKEEVRPKKYQLLLEFTDGSAIAFTVAMYGSISCHSGDYDNEYYRKSIESISPLTEEFDEGYFKELLASVKPAMSVKAFLATEQRMPGLGNGCLQDILFQVFPFHTAHSNEIFHCRIQRGRKCCPNHIFFLLCFFHGDHIGEFGCQRKQVCAVDTQQVFQFTEFFCISRCQTCVEFYFHVISGKCFKTDEHVGFAAEHILHHPFFDFIFQTCQRTRQFDSHIIVTVVDRFHFYHKFPVFCNMLASAIACHASYIRTHVCSFLSKLMFSEPF